MFMRGSHSLYFWEAFNYVDSFGILTSVQRKQCTSAPAFLNLLFNVPKFQCNAFALLFADFDNLIMWPQDKYAKAHQIFLDKF